MLTEGGIQSLFAARNRLASSYTIVDESSSEGSWAFGVIGVDMNQSVVSSRSTCCKDSDSVRPNSSGDASLRISKVWHSSFLAQCLCTSACCLG